MAFDRHSTDRPRQVPSRLLPRAVSYMSVGAMMMAPLAVLSLWLLISDPVTAAAVVERGDLIPVIRAIATFIGHTLAAVLSML